jgi:hypothetical protein
MSSDGEACEVDTDRPDAVMHAIRDLLDRVDE